jgi:hypothetical protein
MPSNPKGYRPKKSRVQFPLTVKQQRTILEPQIGDDGVDYTDHRIRALMILSLSTGMHPKILSEPDRYGLTWTNDYFSWNRVKSRRQVQGAWSKAMREGQNLGYVKKLLGKDVSTYRKAIGGYCEPMKVKMNMLTGRHTNFCNRARLGQDPFSIAHATGTSLKVIMQYYTIGVGEMGTLAEDDRAFLKWLCEV